jgi:hypothetical protein
VRLLWPPRRPVYCPFADIIPLSNGDDLYECNFYENGCDGETPEDSYYSAASGLPFGDCDDHPERCFAAYMFSPLESNPAVDRIEPRAEKLLMNKPLPFRDVEVCNGKRFVTFDGGYGQVTVCIFTLEHFDANHHDRCRFFHLGIEIDPTTCPVKPDQLKKFQTLASYLYTTQIRRETVYLICTQPCPTPTPTPTP